MFSERLANRPTADPPSSNPLTSPARGLAAIVQQAVESSWDRAGSRARFTPRRMRVALLSGTSGCHDSLQWPQSGSQTQLNSSVRSTHSSGTPKPGTGLQYTGLYATWQLTSRSHTAGQPGTPKLCTNSKHFVTHAGLTVWHARSPKAHFSSQPGLPGSFDSVSPSPVLAPHAVAMASANAPALVTRKTSQSAEVRDSAEVQR
jgi:hypothetical protein